MVVATPDIRREVPALGSSDFTNWNPLLEFRETQTNALAHPADDFYQLQLAVISSWPANFRSGCCRPRLYQRESCITGLLRPTGPSWDRVNYVGILEQTLPNASSLLYRAG